MVEAANQSRPRHGKCKQIALVAVDLRATGCWPAVDCRAVFEAGLKWPREPPFLGHAADRGYLGAEQ